MPSAALPRQGRVPAYRRHKRSGNAVVTLNCGGGKRQDVQLSKFNSPESRRKYAQVIAEWSERGRLPEPSAIDLQRITVGELIVMQTLPFLSRQPQAVARLQLLCGARPGELLRLKMRDIEMRPGAPWIFRPSQHKNRDRNAGTEQEQELTYVLNAAAADVLAPFLKADPEAFLFSPAEAEVDRLATLHDARQTPANCGNRPGYNAARRAGRTIRRLGASFTVGVYRTAMGRACARAFPPPPLAQQDGETLAAWRARLTPEQRAELAAWRRAHRWNPHQLRHTFATKVRESHGAEAAQVALGHRTLSATLIYAERTRKMKEDVVSRIG